MEIILPSSRPTSSDTSAPTSALQTSARQVHLDREDLYCILQIEPNDSLIALELARQMEADGQVEDAAKVLRNVVRIDYRFETLFALAKIEYDIDRIDASFECLESALSMAGEQSPLLFDVFKMLGNIFVRRGDLDSAEDSYNRAHRINPYSDILYVNLGTLAVQRQDWDDAVEKFRHALSINRANDRAWVGLAIGHRMKGDIELAWGNLEAALEYDPRNETALTLALDWGVREQREFRVLDLIRNFLVAGGWNERFSLAFASLSFRHGDHFLARLELERLLAVNPFHDGAEALREEMAA